MNIINYSDVTLLAYAYKPYTKPSNEILCIHKVLNYTRSVVRQIPLSIESSLFTLSYNEKIFQEALPISQKALPKYGFKHTLT